MSKSDLDKIEKQIFRKLMLGENLTDFEEGYKLAQEKVIVPTNIQIDTLKAQIKKLEGEVINEYLTGFINGESAVKNKIREFIKEELPSDDIIEVCNNYDVNGVYLREKLEELLEE